MGGIGLSLALLFKLWMLIDAVKRCGVGCGNYWPMVVLFPFGDVVYFFVVKCADPDMQRVGRRLLGRFGKFAGADLTRLRYQVEHCPSDQNRINLLRALVAQREFTEALAQYRLLPSPSAEVQLFAAEALIETGARDEARALVEPLIQKNLGFGEYQAARIFEECLWREGKKAEAITFLESVARQSGRLSVAVHRAGRLAEENKIADALSVLNQALYGYKVSPRFIKRTEFRDALRAWLLRRKLSKGTS